MLLLMTSSVILFLIALALMILSNIISFKTKLDSNKLAPFECGFKHQSNSRPMFSSHFFLVSLLFLIFDIELVLLYPILVKQTALLVYSFYMYFIILFILSAGTLYEWTQKSLEWSG